MSDAQELLEALTADENQQEVLWNLYQQVGEKVSEILLSTDCDSPDFQVFDVVDVAVDETLEEFGAMSGFQVVEQLMTEKPDELVSFLKAGYGNPQEIFDTYREII